MHRYLLGCVLAAGLGQTAGATDGQQVGKEAVTTFALDNGMQVVVVEDHRAPVVQHMVWYRAGSADEPGGASGIAHFLEHLMFKGTDTLEPGEFSATVAANGGQDNAFTSYDYTAYYQRVAVDRLALMMQMEADRMVNLRLEAPEVLTERDVILEERNQRTDNDPGSLFREQMNAVQYLNHPYGIPIIGWRHEIKGLSLQDAQNFYDAHYAPNNAILIVTGDVRPAAVRALAEQHYGSIPANPEIAARARPGEPPQTAARRLTFRDARVAQDYISRSYLAPERDPGAQEQAAALTILQQVLGGGNASYLTQKLQFDQKIAIYSGAFYRGASLDDTTFNVIVVPSPGVSLQAVEDALDQALRDFVKEGVNPEQLDRIRMQLRASQIYDRDNVDGIGLRYGRALASGLTVADVQAWPDVLQDVTAEDIVAAAKAVLRPEASVTGWLMRAGQATGEATQ